MSRTKAKITGHPFPAGLLTYPFAALDVSSTAAGWATFRAGELTGFGVVRLPAKLPSLDRIEAIVRGVSKVVRDQGSTYVVMEYSNGKVHGGASQGLSGLAVLGQAQGEVRRWLIGQHYTTFAVDESWTKGRQKWARAKAVRQHYPAYAHAVDRGDLKDRGLDAADAIGLGVWALCQAREADLIERGTRPCRE